MGLRVQHTDLLGFRGARSTDYALTYSVPVGLPRSLKRSTRKITGRVYDLATLEGVEGVLLHLGPSIAFTREDGTFSFRVPADQTLYLRMDRPSAGLDRIAALRMPLEISADMGPIDDLDIPLALAGRITGAITYNGDAVIGSDVDLGSALIEISDGTNRYRTLTTRDGEFAFEDVFPGTWTVSVVRSRLGRWHSLETESQIVGIEPAESAEVRFPVKDRHRPRTVVDKGVLSLTTQKADPGDSGREATGREPPAHPSSVHPPFDQRTNDASREQLHEVADGETLSGIALRYYGRARLWPHILNANREIVSDPAMIRPGWRLVIPEIAKAVTSRAE